MLANETALNQAILGLREQRLALLTQVRALTTLCSWALCSLCKHLNAYIVWWFLTDIRGSARRPLSEL